jgi:hypothetical protein
MEEAQEKNDKERKDEETVKSIVQKAGWGPSMIQQYAIAFRMLDLDGSGTIDQDELRDGLEMIGRNVSEAQLKDMMAAAELDKEQGLEFPSFVRLFVNATSAKPTKDESAELLLDADQAENKTKRTSVADQELSQPVGLNDSKTADVRLHARWVDLVRLSWVLTTLYHFFVNSSLKLVLSCHLKLNQIQIKLHRLPIL